MRFKRLLLWVASSIFAGMPISQAAASEVDAAGYYKLRCATCHGANGEGTRDKSPSLGPPLRGNPLVINAPVEMLVRVIRHGRGGQQRVYDDAYPNMPAFDAGLVPDVVGLVTYLKTVLQQQEIAGHRRGPAFLDSLAGEAVREAPARIVAAEPADDGDEMHKAARPADVRVRRGVLAADEDGLGHQQIAQHAAVDERQFPMQLIGPADQPVLHLTK